MEITIDPMQPERIIKALQELRKVYRDNKKSKYWFALGYAIKSIKGETECDSCGKTEDVHTYCGYCAENYY